MGFDLSIKFSDPAWYQRSRQRVADMARALPSAIDKSPGPMEIWLKDPASTHPWVYEVRLLFKDDGAFIEVMGFSSAFHEDVRELMVKISRETQVELVDDDGEPV